MKNKLFNNLNSLRVMIIFYFIFSGMFPVFAENNLPRDLVINPDQQYQFAMEYFEKGQYGKAIAEFERFIYFFPDHKRIDNAKYHIGLSYFRSGLFREAIDPFSDIVETSPDQDLIAKAHFRMSETFVNLQEHSTAINVLNHLVETSNDPVFIDEAHYRAGWIYLQLNDVESARHRFQLISPQNRNLFRIQTINEELSREKLFPEKSPRVAGFLSIFPGAGFAYTERYRDALVAFLLNAGLIFAAYESFDSGNEALGGIIAFVGTGFYAGNIYGSVSSAHKYNRDSHQQFLENLRNKTQVVLSVAPEKQGVVLGFRVNF
jgi:tetratricopeptide (TPR) repeat protein